MRISKQNPLREAITPPLPVNKKSKIGVQLLARKVVDGLLPQIAPVIHRVINNEPDKALVLAWIRYGRQPEVRRLIRSTLATPYEQMTPLGQCCILALALGILGMSLPGGIESTRPPRSNAS